MDVTKITIRALCLWNQTERNLSGLDVQKGDNCLFLQEDIIAVLKQYIAEGAATYQKRRVELFHFRSRILLFDQTVDQKLVEFSTLLRAYLAEDANPRKEEVWIIGDQIVIEEILSLLDSTAINVIWYGHSSQQRPIDAYMYRFVQYPVFKQIPCTKGELPPTVVIPFRKEISPYQHSVCTA